MQTVAILTLFLVASQAAAASQEQSAQQQPAQSAPVVVQSVPPQAGEPVVAPVVVEQQAPPAPVVSVESQPQAHHYAEQPQAVVGPKPQQQQVRPAYHQPGQPEQYGQPESASIPPNYKPFGSWGLYIGGNPADGYYTNYYKQLSSQVERAQQPQQQQAGGQQVSALSPLLRQAGGSPYVGADYYPFAYSPADFNVQGGRPYGVEPQQPAAVQVAQAAPVAYVPALAYADHAPSAYAPLVAVDQYAAGATKRLGATKQPQQQQLAAEPREQQQQVQQQVQSGKGHAQQQRVYVYPSPVQVGQLSAPGVASSVVAGSHHHQQQQQPQVVAYPVPVGSQIVGSQQGVDGAFAPYGVHAFTRYAVKPAVVGGNSAQVDPAHHYYYSSGQQPQQQQQQSVAGYKYQQQQQVGGYYAAPLQTYYAAAAPQPLYYSAGPIVGGPQPVEGPAYFGPVSGGEQVVDVVASEVSADNKQAQLVVATNKPQQS